MFQMAAHDWNKVWQALSDRLLRLLMGFAQRQMSDCAVRIGKGRCSTTLWMQKGGQ